MEITKWNKFRLVFGPILLLIAVALLVFWKTIDSVIITALIAGGAVSIITGFSRHLRYSDMPEKDERTRKISAFATAYSWIITLIFISVLVMVNHFNLLKMDVTQVLGLTLFVMLATMVGLHVYFKRKGDVE